MFYVFRICTHIIHYMCKRLLIQVKPTNFFSNFDPLVTVHTRTYLSCHPRVRANDYHSVLAEDSRSMPKFPAFSCIVAEIIQLFL